MPDQDWKTGGLSRQKYVIHKRCNNCDGDGTVLSEQGFQGLDSPTCPFCDGRGMLEVDKDAAYFVLRIDCGEDGPHDPNARAALYDYASYVGGENPLFADDICRWLQETEAAKAAGGKPDA